MHSRRLCRDAEEARSHRTRRLPLLWAADTGWSTLGGQARTRPRRRFGFPGEPVPSRLTGRRHQSIVWCARIRCYCIISAGAIGSDHRLQQRRHPHRRGAGRDRVTSTAQLVCRRRRTVVSASSASRWPRGARGNPVRIRDCPAAVCRNDRRHRHRFAGSARGWEATATRSTVGCAPVSPKTCRLCWARRARRSIASRNGRPAVTVVMLC